MGRILVVNAGSSSLKTALFDGAKRVFEIDVLEISGAARIKVIDGEDKSEEKLSVVDHHHALALALDRYSDLGAPAHKIDGAGHRIVHGGSEFSAPVRLDPETVRRIDGYSSLAPLHNPPAVNAIHALEELAPALPQVGCFDTAFHATAPEIATTFAIPKDLRDAGYRRYGFHGLSYEGLVEKLPHILGKPLPERVLALHLGNGASLCAIRNGLSVATSMGYSPVDGLVMGTRSGAIDPIVALKIAAERGVEEAERILTRESGLWALSGGVSDMRALLSSDSEAARFAIEHYCYWAARQAGSALAAMGGVDVIAFTGGIGENAGPVRDGIMTHLEWTGASVCVVECDEEAVVAQATRRLLE